MLSTILQKEFLLFLSYCLSPDSQALPECAARISWADLLQFAKKQSVVGVYWQGVKRMSGLETNRPSEDDVMDWMVEVSKIAKRNRKVNAVAVKVIKGFRQKGFEACVLKGQGNALLYPDPSSRTSGDIDVYVHPQQQGGRWRNDEAAIRKIITFCKGLDKLARAVYHHIDIPAVDKVPVEVHYRATWLNAPVNNRRLQNLLSTLLSRKDGTKHVALPEEAGDITIPGFSFNVVFQLSHILNHLLHEGVGLRQLVDYYYLLRSHACSKEDQAWLDTSLKRCGLHQISSAVSWVLANVLGLPERYLITKPNERYGQQLMREMIAGGNFGKYDERLLSGTSHSKLVANIQRLVRDVRMLAYYPSECLWEPWFRVWHWVWRKKHNSFYNVLNSI
jgi:hypothetical protein